MKATSTNRLGALGLPQQIIIDTDPGVDDVLAMLLAFSSKADELCVRLISVTYGNVEVEKCLRNVITLFHQIQNEKSWRKAQGLDEGFSTLKKWKPIVSVGASCPLGEQGLMADHFHGLDGLGGAHTTHPHLSPADSWKEAFQSEETISKKEPFLSSSDDFNSLFTPSLQASYLVMLDILRESPPDTITIIALGPLTNLALAAAKDPETFLRAKEVVVMGGAIDVPGNISPLGEFNIYADPIAAARVFALTSPNPQTTLPPPPYSDLGPYPSKLSRKLRLVLYSLDTTTLHNLTPETYTSILSPLLSSADPQPMATWLSAFLPPTFGKLASIYNDPTEPLSLHDPLCVWHMLANNPPMQIHEQPIDVRIEVGGMWSRGFCITDRRGKFSEKKRKSSEEPASMSKKTKVLEEVQSLQQPQEKAKATDEELGGMDEVEAMPGDHGGWMTPGHGNRIYLADSEFDAWKDKFGEEMLMRILGLKEW